MKRPLSPFEQELVNAMDEYAHSAVPPAFNATRIVARERQRVRMRISLAAVCVATAAGVASCVATSVPGNGNKGLPVVGNTNTPVSVTASPTPSASPHTNVSPSETTGGSPSAARGGGASSPTYAGFPPLPTTPTSSPFTGTVPPVPVLKSIEPVGNFSLFPYSAIAFEFNGQAPGFTARYVNQVVHEGSGAPISMPGSAFLQLTFSSAQAHDDSGNSTLNPPATNPVSFGPHGVPEAYVVNGDFEGVVTVTLSLDSKRGFHISEQTLSPTDHVIDVSISTS